MIEHQAAMKILSTTPVSAARWLVTALIFTVISCPVLADTPATSTTRLTLQVAPSAVSLSGFNLQQQIQVTVQSPGDLPTDATRTATFQLF